MTKQTIMAAGLGLVCMAALAVQVELAWDPSRTDGSITNYSLYWGTSAGSYTNFFTVGTNLTGTVTGLMHFVGVYHFAATATDTNGIESDFSAEAVWPAGATHVLGQTFSGSRPGPRRLGNGAFH